ncbi:TPA: MFS transporter [Citrobacter freundii]
MPVPSRDIVVLTLGQALTSTVISLLTSVSSLSGEYLAPSAVLSTLPVSATVLGTLIMIYPASALMGRLGRRKGFMFKASLGIVGGGIAATGLLFHHFLILTLGTFLLGLFNAFGQYYRFAAIDAAKEPEQKATFVAVVMGAGVVGGIAGPFLGSHSAGLLNSTPYAGAFIALLIVCILLAVSQMFLSPELGLDVDLPAKTHSEDTGLIEWNSFFRASVICAIGFAVMTLTMNSAPLAIHNDGFSMQHSGLVLQFHFALMYLPSFINPLAIKYIRVNGLVLAGVVLSATGCLLPFVVEQTLPFYILELSLAGIGWNFMFNGGTLLVANTYRPMARVRAQGINSLLVYSANIIASFSSGSVMAVWGWRAVNLACIPLLVVAVLALCWKPYR